MRAELIACSEALRRAAQLDAAASENISAAGANVRASREKAAREREDARVQEESAVEAAQREETTVIRAAERSDAAAADAKLKDAQKKRDTAATSAAQADRLEELADSEKVRRANDCVVFRRRRSRKYRRRAVVRSDVAFEIARSATDHHYGLCRGVRSTLRHRRARH